MELGFLFVAFLIGHANLLVYCYFGKLATESYEKMTDCLYECDWQKLPIDLQKYIVLMIQNTQLLQFYHGFGVFILNLETFTRVRKFIIDYLIDIKIINIFQLIKAIFTYYMMLKTITSD